MGTCALLAACLDSLSPEDFYGSWAGEGARLTLSETRALFESACWAGEMAIPIQVDDRQFTAIGTVQRQGGTGTPESRAVILTGRREGDALRLTLDPANLGGPYRLERDAVVVLPGCP